jgi:hypothetical protein
VAPTLEVVAVSGAGKAFTEEDLTARLDAHKALLAEASDRTPSSGHGES